MPVFGTPTCCIAFEQTAVTQFSNRRVADMEKVLEGVRDCIVGTAGMERVRKRCEQVGLHPNAPASGAAEPGLILMEDAAAPGSNCNARRAAAGVATPSAAAVAGRSGERPDEGRAPEAFRRPSWQIRMRRDDGEAAEPPGRKWSWASGGGPRLPGRPLLLLAFLVGLVDPADNERACSGNRRPGHPVSDENGHHDGGPRRLRLSAGRRRRSRAGCMR